VAGTRRSFLKVLGFAAGGAAIVGGVMFRHAKGAAADWYRKLVELDKDAPGGQLTDAEVQTLLAATRVLLVDGIEEQRYDDFFRWKAENAGGYLGLYRSFARALDEGAGDAGAKSFTAADAAIQKKVIGRAKEVRRMINDDDKVGGLRFALLDREWLLYERYIVREVLTLFAKTDAWLLSGYGSPPGVPRGLEAYLVKPEAT
jgi:hypothetical protein